MGSHANLIAKQGQGYRTKQLLYATDEDVLYIFGYGEPFLWLRNRGLVRTLANDRRAHVLTDEGEQIYRKLLLSGAGEQLNELTRKATIKPLTEPSS